MKNINHITTLTQIEEFLFELKNLARTNGVRFWQRSENMSMMNMLELT